MIVKEVGFCHFFVEKAFWNFKIHFKEYSFFILEIIKSPALISLKLISHEKITVFARTTLI